MRPYEVAHKMGYIDCRERCKLLPPTVKEITIIRVDIDAICVEWVIPAVNMVSQSPVVEVCEFPLSVFSYDSLLNAMNITDQFASGDPNLS
jgi:UDP-N-acetylmuramyl pentapeptide phosphotransferase/UDP-N-acetylglucosamine-1-phosphate transferase